MFRVARAFSFQHGAATSNNKTKTASDAAAGSSGNHEPKLDGAASGAAKGVATEIVGPASPGPVSIAQLLELQSGQALSIEEYLSKWAAEMKAYVDFELMSFRKFYSLRDASTACRREPRLGSGSLSPGHPTFN